MPPRVFALFLACVSLAGCVYPYTSEEDVFFAVSVEQQETCPPLESVLEQVSASMGWTALDGEYLSRATYEDKYSKLCWYRFEASREDDASRTELCAVRPTLESIRRAYTTKPFQRSRTPRRLQLQGNGRVEPRRDEWVQVGPDMSVSVECAMGLPVAVENVSLDTPCRAVGDLAPELTLGWKEKQRRIVEVDDSTKPSGGWAECRYRVEHEVEVTKSGL
jgi:hypothetical protein